ncbi:MAG TPA: hypothetical protein VLJ39_13415 [Tepidisphaeraceae bacterium]|nr:hypothetical protein [Tepidisphaeraceae bacterium]
MATTARKSAQKQQSAQKLAARKAEEAAAALHSFAATLAPLDIPQKAGRTPTPSPRNWWRVQAGRFKDDPTFADFVAEVQAARKHEG